MNRSERRRQEKKRRKATVPDPQPLPAQDALDSALKHLATGNLPEAEKLCQHVLQADPDHPIALNMLGVIAHHVGKNDIAAELLSKAILNKPDYAEAHNNLGAILEKLGDADKAAASYRRAIALMPDFAKAHFSLGNALGGLGQTEEALASYQQAFAIKADYAEAYCNHGQALAELGRLEEAAASLNKAIAINPNIAEAHNNLGNVMKKLEKSEEAVGCYRRAIDIRPDYAEVYLNLGNTFNDLGETDEAISNFQKAIAINPEYVDAYTNLGNTYKNLERLEDAGDCYNKTLSIRPDYAEGHNNLGITYGELGQARDAVESYLKALAIKPEYAEAHGNLGNALRQLGKLDEAEESLRRAMDLNPDLPEVHNNLGSVLKDQKKLDQAMACFAKALDIKPDYVEAHSNMGNTYREMGRQDEAVESYQKALAINPDYTEGLNNLGSLYNELGQPVKAAEIYAKALDIKPDFAFAHSNLLMTEQYRLGHTSQSLFQLHSQWDERHAHQFRADRPVHGNNREPERKLRVGFVSPDLGRHPVGYFILAMLESLGNHDIETVCFSDRIGDEMTQQIKAAAGAWRDIYGESDEDLAKMIVSDGIDILIDLSGHSASNRLLVFARKPAPVQVAWAGYVGTTGLSAIDYLISDIYSTPEEDEPFYSEKVIRMPDGWLCYAPPAYAPEVGPLPFERNAGVTFASFSNPAKINEAVVSVWADVLKGVERSRLVLKFRGIDSGANAKRLTSMFQAEGVDPSRLILEGKSSHPELLARYNDVDIALDPFPYSGGLTTYEALWMGVPVITVAGETFASRHSLSHLSTVGLPELVARDHEDYVNLAVALAVDIERLADLRAGLREKMARSPICDGEKFSQGFAGLLRGIWRDWCMAQDRKSSRV
ncbi:MAG: tetratricopeptide repeat protein [Rhodospirillales bacterium]|nr:tetratricopeptide repeat protein [Alphaproteobacteria bacterium]MBL6947999.1 tetratricopeptide repeat protein [Rhodospirillales bacterium]